MTEPSDADLLEQYTRENSGPAFAALVERHLGLVHSVALRHTVHPQHAQDITQAVFILLARKASSLNRQTILAGWLYHAARLTAANVRRAETSRIRREQEAFMQFTLNETAPDAAWQEMSPLLDEAMSHLNAPDRDALVLRYFQNKTLFEVGAVMGLEERAAQKRVTRAVEKLRKFFIGHGVTLPAAVIAGAVSAHSVQAVPAGLSALISATALSGTTVTTAALAAATKAMLMTTLQKTLITTALTVTIGAGIFEAQQNSRLRAQNQAIQQQQTPLAGQVLQLSHALAEATNQNTALRDELARLNRNTAELLALRGEVGRLRNHQAPPPSADSQNLVPVQASPAAAEQAALENIGRELGAAVVRGDAGALEQVVNLAKSEHAAFNTNSVGLDDTQRGQLSSQTFAPLQAAFDIIAEAAAQNNQFALNALVQAAQISELQGMTVQSLGTLAGKGDDGVLDILLNYQKYGFSVASAVGALQPAADSGNEKAIDALAAVTRDPGQKPLWSMAAFGLQKAAASGNSTAIDSLIGLLSNPNPSVQNAAISGLKPAAAQNLKAAQALQAASIQY